MSLNHLRTALSLSEVGVGDSTGSVGGDGYGGHGSRVWTGKIVRCAMDLNYWDVPFSQTWDWVYGAS